MPRLPATFAVLLAACTFVPAADLVDAPKPPAGFPKFKIQEIDAGLKIGYAVIVVDIDGDKKPDIVVVDQLKIVWYQNPTWKKRVILDGKTKPDNVCIAALDIDGDKLPELVVGAGWKPFDTKNPGTLQWLKRGKSLDDEWTMHAIPCDEPMVHRIQVADLYGDGKPRIVVLPLMGKGATQAKQFLDGRPVNILVYAVPAKDPEKKESWKPEVLNGPQSGFDGYEYRVTHNFDIDPKPHVYQPRFSDPPKSYRLIHVASNTGVLQLWVFPEADRKLNQALPLLSTLRNDPKEKNKVLPASEVRWGLSDTTRSADAYLATVEPWHGNLLVVYPETAQGRRKVLDDHLRWGHAIRCAELTDEKMEFIVLGVRDDPDLKQGDKFKERRGVRIYRNTDGKGAKWERYILEDGGVAVEDLAVEDLDGDGKPDIIAVGRATGNCRIYWNKGVAK